MSRSNFQAGIPLFGGPKDPDGLAFVYQQLTDNVKHLAQFPLLTFTKPAILRTHQLLAMKLGVRKMDLRIAAIALEHNAIVVTRNLRDFQRVPNLLVEDWSV